MKKYLWLMILLVILFSAPNFALASWWNPFTWFGKTTTPTGQQPIPTNLSDLSPPPLGQTGMTPQQVKDKQKNSVAKKTETLKPVAKRITASSVSGCTSTTGYSTTTGLSCSGDGSCVDGSFKYKGINTCLTPLAYCQSALGSDATYNSTSNLCHTTKTANAVCNNAHVNTTWNGTYDSSGKYGCVCQTGYTLDSASNSCFKFVPQQQTQQQAEITTPRTSTLDATDTKFMTEAKEYTQKLNEMRVQVKVEIESAGGFSTPSLVESLAMQRLKELGIKPPVSANGSLNSSTGGYTSVKCNSLGSGYDCFSSDGTRIQGQQIPGSNSFQINSW